MIRTIIGMALLVFVIMRCARAFPIWTMLAVIAFLFLSTVQS